MSSLAFSRRSREKSRLCFQIPNRNKRLFLLFVHFLDLDSDYVFQCLIKKKKIDKLYSLRLVRKALNAHKILPPIQQPWTHANTESARLLHVWESERGLICTIDLKSLLRLFWGLPRAAACGLSGSIHNNSVFQFFNGEMNGGESIWALEFMAANWHKVQSSLLPPWPCIASHTAMANNTTWLQHHGAWQQLAHTIMSWNKQQNLHFSFNEFTSSAKLFPENCAFFEKALCWFTWSISRRVSCSVSPVTGRKRLLRQTCHTWRATEQQEPKNDNSEHHRVWTQNWADVLYGHGGP